MDVLRIDRSGTTLPVWFPDILIEGYQSMIWTERYTEPGQFQMTTSDVSRIRELIPEGSCITLRDSREVMMVETHSVSEDETTGIKTNVITGRSLDFFPEENRVFRGKAGRAKKFPQSYNLTQAALMILYNAIQLPLSTNDLIYGTDDLLFRGDRLSDTKISDSTSAAIGASRTRYIDKPDYIGPELLRLLNAGHIGLRTLRPINNDSEDYQVVTIASDGAITKTATDGSDLSDYMLFDFYDGANRTHGQDVLPRVVFQHSAGHIADPEYLWTNGLKKEQVWGTTSKGVHFYFDDDAYPLDTFPSGWGKTQTFLDTGDDYVDLPDGGGWGGGEDYDALYNAMEDEWSKHRDTFFFDAKISELAPYRYGEDYFLGDKVTLLGEYGAYENVRVMEYTRTEDEQGERGLPTLVKI